jgi:hypothetical protein
MEVEGGGGGGGKGYGTYKDIKVFGSQPIDFRRDILRPWSIHTHIITSRV